MLALAVLTLAVLTLAVLTLAVLATTNFSTTLAEIISNATALIMVQREPA